LLVGIVPTGCVTHWQGKEMSADIIALQAQVEQVVEDQRGQRKKLAADVQNIDRRIAKIEAALTKAIGKLQDDSVNNDSLIETLRAEIAQLRGDLAKWQHDQGQKNKGPGSVLPEIKADAGMPKLPKSADDLYRYGYERKSAKDCDESIRAFSQLVNQFPKHERADSALFLAAQCQASKNDHEASIRTLRVVLTKYKRGKKIDDALELTHDAFMHLGKCKTALTFIEELVAEHPRYKHRRRAQKKLRKARRKCGKK
jgi:TolA-binding protein